MNNKKNFWQDKKLKEKQKNQSKYNKSLGQHFLRNQKIATNMVDKVNIQGRVVVEVGCGDGVLTKTILSTDCLALIVVEIDSHWADFVKQLLGSDKRLQIVNQDVLTADFVGFIPKDSVFLANLPYNISFPILKKLVQSRQLFEEGVFMVQEELAQKVCALRGKDRGSISVYLQTFFDFELMDKVLPKDFEPAPNVFSRTVYFKRKDLQSWSETYLNYVEEDGFWDFVRKCFHNPRQTLLNNLKKEFQGQEWIFEVEKSVLDKRPGNLKLQEFFMIWEKIKS